MNHAHKNNYDAYNRLINKITQVTKNDNNSNVAQQNRETISHNLNEEGIKQNNYNPNLNNNQNEILQNQRRIFERMNQKLMNNRRNADFGQNQSYNNEKNNNGKNYTNRSEIDKEKVFLDNNLGNPLGGGKNAPIVRILNQRNSEIQYQNPSQNINNSYFNPSKNIIIENKDSNNPPYNPLKTNIQNYPKFNNSINLNYQNKNDNKAMNYNFSQKFPENSINYNNNNPNGNLINLSSSEVEDANNPDDNSKIFPSLLYGLILGSFGTLLLWCKNPEVRNYLKECYKNINSESIANFFKSFLHPIDLFKSLGSNFNNALKQSLSFLYRFIDDYADLWRLLGVIVMVYIFWLIIKMIYYKITKRNKKKKKVRKDANYNIAH